MKFQNKKTWKYKTYDRTVIQLHRKFPRFKHRFFEVNGSTMIIEDGYTWNGANRPAINTEKMIMLSLPHDVFYQAIREQILDEVWKKDADLEIKDMYKERSTKWFSWFGNIIHFAVDKFGKSSIECDIIEVK